jgi:hypothetical protein
MKKKISYFLFKEPASQSFDIFQNVRKSRMNKHYEVNTELKNLDEQVMEWLVLMESPVKYDPMA